MYCDVLRLRPELSRTLSRSKPTEISHRTQRIILCFFTAVPRVIGSRERRGLL